MYVDCKDLTPQEFERLRIESITKKAAENPLWDEEEEATHVNPVYAIRCVETGVTYTCARDAETSLDLPTGSVTRVTRSGAKTRGLSFVRLHPQAPRRRKPILCTDTGRVFTGPSEAAEWLGVSKDDILVAVRRKRILKGHRFVSAPTA